MGLMMHLWGVFRRMAGLVLWVAMTGGAMAASATGPAPLLPVADFAHRPVMADVEISPDGSHIAYLTPIGGRQHLAVRKLPIDPAEKPALLAPSNAEIISLEWVSNQRLILRILGTEEVRTRKGHRPLRFIRLVSVTRDLSTTKVLLQRPAEGNSYILQSTPILHHVDDEHVLVAYPTKDGPWPGVVNLNIVNGTYKSVRPPVKDVRRFVPDPTGEIRIALTYDDDEMESRYLRRVAGGGFEPMQIGAAADGEKVRGFKVLGFDAQGKDLYVSSRQAGDRAAVYKYDMARDQIGEKVADDPRFDVNGAVVKRGVVVAIAWTDDLPRRLWLDPAVQQQQDALDKAVPDSREIILDTAADGNLILVASYSMTQPTTFRLFDRRTRLFDMVGDTYPTLAQDYISPRRPVTFKATDGTEIPGYLTLPVGVPDKNLPFVILPHGGPFARDTGEFDANVQFLVNRGYGVLQPNFRGSTGYGAAFNAAGRRQWGGLMQDDVTDAARWAVAQGYADPQRLCIVGWSYGGYAALMGAVKTPDLFKCAIATAPVANLERLYDDLRLSSAKNLSRGLHFGNKRDSLNDISPVHQVDKIKIPVLLIHGDLDYQAAVEHSRDMEKALRKAGKTVDYIEIEDMDHMALVTKDMATILSAWEQFLKAHIGPGAS